MVKVVTGVRGPHKPEERVEEPVHSHVEEGEVAYGSSIKHYRVQITAPYDIHNAATGRVTKAEPKVAQFREFAFIASDPEIIKELDKIAGIGKKLWRQADLTKAVAAAKDEEIRKFVAKDPEKVAQMLKEITGAKDVASLAK